MTSSKPFSFNKILKSVGLKKEKSKSQVNLTISEITTENLEGTPGNDILNSTSLKPKDADQASVSSNSSTSSTERKTLKRLLKNAFHTLPRKSPKSYPIGQDPNLSPSQNYLHLARMKMISQLKTRKPSPGPPMTTDLVSLIPTGIPRKQVTRESDVPPSPSTTLYSSSSSSIESSFDSSLSDQTLDSPEEWQLRRAKLLEEADVIETQGEPQRGRSLERERKPLTLFVSVGTSSVSITSKPIVSKTPSPSPTPRPYKRSPLTQGWIPFEDDLISCTSEATAIIATGKGGTLSRTLGRRKRSVVPDLQVTPDLQVEFVGSVKVNDHQPTFDSLPDIPLQESKDKSYRSRRKTLTTLLSSMSLAKPPGITKPSHDQAFSTRLSPSEGKVVVVRDVESGDLRHFVLRKAVQRARAQYRSMRISPGAAYEARRRASLGVT